MITIINRVKVPTYQLSVLILSVRSWMMASAAAPGEIKSSLTWNRTDYIISDCNKTSIATPALLCHKEPAQGTQSSLPWAFLVFRWFFMA